ncbi:MAG TPA: DUF1697 domain-containing protein [Candidatus Limnocylindrales bacterium]|nr:DUF1697 domain-containing protein [Candidatus Limnocylindrales bacterium]
MNTLISLLRGINVGGHNVIRMEDLRAIYAGLKFKNVQTYVQSGNVVFQFAGPDPAAKIEAAIEKKYGFRPTVITRTAEEIEGVLARNPFPAAEPNRLIVTFCRTEPATRAVLELNEQMHLHGRELYIYYPNGQGKPNVPWTKIEKALGVPGTGRNWNTVNKLLEMAKA